MQTRQKPTKYSAGRLNTIWTMPCEMPGVGKRRSERSKDEKTLTHYRGAGFSGSHVVRLMVNRYPEYEIVNLDLLTYAGNLGNLTDIADAPNYHFVRADIADAVQVYELFKRFAFDGVIHLAAESHVDRSIEDPLSFVRTNVIGTVNLLNACREQWAGQMEEQALCHIFLQTRYTAHWAQKAFSWKPPPTTRTAPTLLPRLPQIILSGPMGKPTVCHTWSQIAPTTMALSNSRKNSSPTVHSQHQRGKGTSCWRRSVHKGLALRHRPCKGHRQSVSRRAQRRDLQHRRVQ